MCQSGSPIEPEDRDVEDSGIEDMGVDLSSTTSISSSIMKHREENGRTYHAYKEGKYQYPNDEAEKDRLDLQHHLFQLTFDRKIYTAPLDTIALHNVLDVGTGTGIWAIDFADEHPETQVLGVDLSPIQPMFTAPNATFQVDDLEEPWTFSVKFDYIHSRMMTGSFTNWSSFFEKCFGYLNPGGYVELADTVFPLRSDDDTLPDASPLKKHIDMCSTAANQIGRPLDTAKLYKEQLATAGFINITEVVYKWPINAWPKEKKMKEIGMWTLENLGGGLSGLSMALCTRVLGMSVEETESWLVEVLKDMKDPKIHAYFPLYVVYAQKPL